MNGLFIRLDPAATMRVCTVVLATVFMRIGRWLPLACLGGMASFAASPPEGQIDDCIRQEMSRRHVPGLSVAIVQQGKVVFARGYGVADVAREMPATPATPFQLASATKPFVATAILILAEDGKLRLDDLISQYVPGLPTSWQKITLRQLLTHTSGIPNYLGSKNTVWERGYTAREVVAIVEGTPLRFEPGTRWEYSNTGFVLLGVILERVTGQRYDQFLATRVFGPLGMTSTRRAGTAEGSPSTARGYQWIEGKRVDAERLNPALWNNGDGGLESSVADLAAFDAALASRRILSLHSQEESWAPAELSKGRDARTMFDTQYGLGWFIERDRGHRLVWHSGGRPGAVSTIARFVDDGLTVIVLGNLDGWNPIDLARNVAGLYFPALKAPRMMVGRPESDPKLGERLLAAATVLGYGAGDTSMFTDGQRMALVAGGRASLISALDNKTSFDFLGEDDVSERGVRLDGVSVARVRYYNIRQRTQTTPMSFFLTRNGLVAWIQQGMQY